MTEMRSLENPFWTETQIIEDLSIKETNQRMTKSPGIGFLLSLSFELEVVEISFWIYICENLRPD